MKFIKNFKLFENKSIYDLNIEVTDAGPNNVDGGVQIDTITLSINNKDAYFELATTLDGTSHVTYQGGYNKEFEKHFQLIPDKRMSIYNIDKKIKESYLELISFIGGCAFNSEVGELTTIDGFDIEISDISHEGGKEFGHLFVLINNKEITLEIEQDATGYALDSTIYYSDEESEKIGVENGLNLDTEEAQDFFFNKYDSICNDNR